MFQMVPLEEPDLLRLVTDEAYDNGQNMNTLELLRGARQDPLPRFRPRAIEMARKHPQLLAPVDEEEPERWDGLS